MKASFAVQILMLVLPFACGVPLEKVVGGTAAEISSYPYQVSMRSLKNRHICGGSIIGDQWILTAAHCCVGRTATSILIITGTDTLNAGGFYYSVSEIISHPSYSDKNNSNDIALLKVSSKIVYGPTVKPVALALDHPLPGTMLTLTGWGFTKYPSDTIPNNLQTVLLTTISIKQCKSSLPGYPITDNHVCTFESKDKGSCHGDSGGPLVYNGLQVGIVSWGIPCAKGYPDIFTAVAPYISWIGQSTASSL